MALKLTDPAFLEELEGLRFIPRVILPGRISGERSSPRRGSSQEFADYRSYTIGDDPRFLDWNVYARLRKPYLKLFQAEEQIDAYLLLDLSGSMGWGSPPKLQTALQVAAALAYLVLSGEDRIGLLTRSKISKVLPKAGQPKVGSKISSSLRSSTPRVSDSEDLSDVRPEDSVPREQNGLTEEGESLGYKVVPPVRGTGALLSFLRTLEGLSAGSSLLPGRDLRHLLTRVKRRSLLFFLSDCLFEEGYERALRHLAVARHPVTVIQILHPMEMDPPLEGNLTLVDVESGEERNLSVDAGIRERYRRLLRRWNDGLAAYCSRHGMGYIGAQAGEPVREILLRFLSRTAWQWKR